MPGAPIVNEDDVIYRPNLPTFGDEEIDFKDLMNHPLARVYGETNEELRNILKKITDMIKKRSKKWKSMTAAAAARKKYQSKQNSEENNQTDNNEEKESDDDDDEEEEGNGYGTTVVIVDDHKDLKQSNLSQRDSELLISFLTVPYLR